MTFFQEINRHKLAHLLLAFTTFSLSTTSTVMAAPTLQQSLLNVDRAQNATPTPPRLTKKQIQEMKARLKTGGQGPQMTKKDTKALMAYIKKYQIEDGVNPGELGGAKHPHLTYTAKSVFTLAGVPMQWGGVGFSGGFFNGDPTSTRDSWPGGASAALPFGDSDKYIGGSVGVSWISLGNTESSSTTSNNTGTVALVFSRWLGANTIATAGVLNLAPWGVMKQAPKSYTGALTQMFGANMLGGYHQMSASIGLGTGALGPLGSVSSGNDNNVYPFVNAAFNFTPNFAIAGDYYSETFAVGLSYDTAIKFSTPIPLSFMLFAGNLRHTSLAPSTTYGLRVSTGFELPSFKRAV